MDDIILPDFYKDIAELEGITFIQGSYLIEKPHYDRKEQFVCLIDGRMDMRLVPHFNRQEVYAGKDIVNTKYNDAGQGNQPKHEDQVNTSPINFFAPNRVKFKNFERAI
jgi:hypothetical protein